jgi:hypothetical protein
MKRRILVSLLLIGFLGGGCESEPVSSNPAENYFPLAIGNYWEFERPNSRVPVHRLQIWDSVEIYGKTYFAYGTSPEQTIWIRGDDEGRIWQFSNNRRIIWFDFSLENGDYYKFNDQPVRVVKHETMMVNDVTYHDCIEFRFDHPEWVDDEVNFVFAAEIGPIKIYGAWVYYELVNYNRQ